MKHFTITTKEQAEALRPYNVTPQDPFKVGHIITPSANEAYHTCWDEYPEADALTFEECMSIVRDEVTEEVLRELGAVSSRFLKVNDGWQIELMSSTVIELVAVCETITGQVIDNMTATKLRLLVAILRGE